MLDLTSEAHFRPNIAFQIKAYNPPACKVIKTSLTNLFLFVDEQESAHTIEREEEFDFKKFIIR